MEYLQIFSQRVYELRKKRGLSQKELGEAVGLSHKAISTIESGARSTTIEKLIALRGAILSHSNRQAVIVCRIK